MQRELIARTDPERLDGYKQGRTCDDGAGGPARAAMSSYCVRVQPSCDVGSSFATHSGATKEWSNDTH